VILLAWHEDAGIPKSPSVSRALALSPAAVFDQPLVVPGTTAPPAATRVTDPSTAGSHAQELPLRVLEAVYGSKRPTYGDEVDS
jgi:hypothetical protein